MLSGLASSGQSDAGVTAKFIGSLLTYLSDKTTQSFFAFTANDVTTLPPELTRKGRVDQTWFIDIPSRVEREEIVRIHLAKVRDDISKFNARTIAAASDGFTGAELEGCIHEAMFNAFDKDREFTTEDVVAAIKLTVPISVSRKEDIDGLRAWAKTRARIANGKMLIDNEVRTGKRAISKDAKWSDDTEK